MDTPPFSFDQLRPRLQAIAYRMLGATGDAEEVVQDAWLKWHAANRQTQSIDNHEAWLVTATTRLAIDRLRAEKTRREHYAGIWLPEPLLVPSPEEMAERADDVSFAFLLALERLSPESRAAFLLREVFDVDYPEIAAMIDKSETACRQLVSRARTQLKDSRARHQVSPAVHLRLLRSFADAAVRGDTASMNAFLAETAELIGDGGGKVPSFPKPLRGGARIANLYLATYRQTRGAMRIELVGLNGQWGLMRFVDHTLESAQVVETDGARIIRLYVQRNPDKLATLLAAWRTQSAAG